MQDNQEEEGGTEWRILYFLSPILFILFLYSIIFFIFRVIVPCYFTAIATNTSQTNDEKEYLPRYCEYELAGSGENLNMASSSSSFVPSYPPPTYRPTEESDG